jgi:hypothetical protein
MLNQFNKNICRKRALCSLFAFLLGLLSFVDLHAQQFPECFNYEVGSVNRYKQIHHLFTSDYIDDELNKKGSCVIWNLHDSEIVYSSSDLIQEIVPATMVFGYNNFVTANVVKKFGPEYPKFLLQDSSGIRLVGIMSDQVEKYIDKKMLINYPHWLFECSIDSFEIDSLHDFFGDWITDIKGITQNCFDAEGEIHFNSGLIVPAFRYTRIDTMRYLIRGGAGMQIDMETYWYDSNCNLHTPIIFAKGYQDANGFQHYSTIYILKEYALGLDDDLKEDEASFNFKINSEEILLSNTSGYAQTIALIDLTGRKISEKEVKPYQNTISFATNQLGNGICFLKSSNGNSYKISIVH